MKVDILCCSDDVVVGRYRDEQGNLKILVEPKHKVEVGEVAPGSHIFLEGTEFIVIQHGSFYTECITAESQANMIFGDDKFFHTSAVRKFIEGSFFQKFLRLKESRFTRDVKVDVRADNGALDINHPTCVAGLLSAEEYRKHYYLLREIKSNWWLSTPKTYNTDSLIFSKAVCCVNPDGDISYMNPTQAADVHPVLSLDNKTTVDVVVSRCEYEVY